MGGEVLLAILGVAVLPFGAYGVAGIWAHWKSRPRNAAEVLAERYALGEIDDAEYARRLSIITYGPPLALPTFTTPDPDPQRHE